ncbi:MAG: efflux RND transporter periplasmic adaptor subunit [Cyanobacteriota bacterium]
MNDAIARGLATDDPTYIQQNADWLAAEAKYKNQQAVIDQAKASLNSAWLSYQSTSPIVTAPIAGMVSNVGVVTGVVLASQATSTNQTTTSSQRVAVIQNETNPIISVNITEIDVPKVKIGQKVTVTLDSLPDKTFTGKVVTADRIGTISNNVTSYPSLIQLDTASSEILPNMAANTNIIIETKADVLLVPSTAIQSQTGEDYVRVLRNGREQQIPVEIGLQGDTQTEITSGLSEGDEVITGIVTQTQQGGGSVFGGGGFGGGAFKPGSFGGGR